MEKESNFDSQAETKEGIDSDNLRKEIVEYVTKESQRAKHYGDSGGEKFDVRELTERDLEIWYKINQRTLTEEELKEWRGSFPVMSPGQKPGSRERYLNMVNHRLNEPEVLEWYDPETYKFISKK